ncbi:hypothetical protein YE105_C2951 [Yersinia enterocolitica subsp. palearctica 105.5R(r)]|uniref:Uncharacterized protein n=2 Tax=Yersinia enterocolitica TaxID=630 RepID=A0A0H3NXE9_YERE1|nr:hypothetical protein YE105_C2951 [Yersinia enterocolitica subsp. palearctica 105.5R(r)]CBX73408.1 unknown protein [Yersinia enterocolitica W22703]CBY28167.1 hypothetical protein Y11_00141 [Yersinia enterocolitica subsp. palearctica Y11]CCO67168.1 hypothetical protein D322_272 [Yersinia enterocolitica IP 10393]
MQSITANTDLYSLLNIADKKELAQTFFRGKPISRCFF